ncbi:MAG: hypothetical protein RML12_03145 [Xanthomonadales bacterium]|nr:hypothetical protein [Xanthomonadales bacterium]
MLPALRPAWIAGLILVLMETLADYGAVSVLGVETLTVGIFRVWHGMQSLEAAAQLATLLLLPVAMLLFAERRLGRAVPGGGEDGGRRIPLPRAGAALALGAVLAVLAAALLIPLLAMIAWARAHPWPIARLLALATDTVLLGAAVAAAVTSLGLALALCERAGRQAASLRLAVALAGLGYALPGAVLAVGMLALAAPLAHAPGLSFLGIGSLALLLVALSLRFLRLGHGTAAAGLARIRPSLGEAARTLGASRRRRLLALYLPMLRPSLAAAALLALLETMKELPATLLLRPFGWDTLAVRIHAYAAEGMWREAAMPGSRPRRPGASRRRLAAAASARHSPAPQGSRDNAAGPPGPRS